MTHHMITDEHIHITCMYCGNDLCTHLWSSEWNADHHYKFTTCEKCGKKTHKPMEFHGSGHDDWHVRAYSALENKVFDKTREK